MAIWSTSTSTTTGAFITNGSWLVAAPPPPPPYTGSYLPAVIHVFDHELDLADRKVDELAAIANQLEQEFVSLNRKATASCLALEPEYPDHIRDVRNLELRVRTLTNKINRLRSGNALPSPDEDAAETESTTEEDIAAAINDVRPDDKEAYEAAVNRMLEQMRERDKVISSQQKRVKNGPTKVKALFRKIMMLIHPDRHRPNKYTQELYVLAERARQQEDLNALTGILVAAKQYRSNQSTLALRNFLNQKAEALRNHVSQAQQSVRQIRRDPAYQVHELMQAGRRDDAKDLYLAILQNMQAALTQKMNSLEFEHSALTGTFSDGSTRTTF